MDIGSGAYTEYDLDKSLMSYMMKKNLDLGVNCFMGHVHSHHNMKVYFSVTDEDELCINAPQHNAYLSIIVNNASEVVGKIAQVIEAKSHTKRNSSFAKFSGDTAIQELESSKEETVVISYDAEIEKAVKSKIAFSLALIEEDSETEIETIDAEVYNVIENFLLTKTTASTESYTEWQERMDEVKKAKAAKAARPVVAYNWQSQGKSDFPGTQKTFPGFEIQGYKQNQAEREISRAGLSIIQDDAASFNRHETEHYLKKCLNVDTKIRIVSFNEFLAVAEMNAHTIDNLINDPLQKNFLAVYNELYPEDTTYDHLDELLDECISVMDTYYSESAPSAFICLMTALDEVQTMWSDLISTMDQDDVPPTPAEQKLVTQLEKNKSNVKVVRY